MLSCTAQQRNPAEAASSVCRAIGIHCYFGRGRPFHRGAGSAADCQPLARDGGRRSALELWSPMRQTGATKFSLRCAALRPATITTEV